jgi:hypothetical protein
MTRVKIGKQPTATKSRVVNRLFVKQRRRGQHLHNHTVLVLQKGGSFDASIMLDEVSERDFIANCNPVAKTGIRMQ